MNNINNEYKSNPKQLDSKNNKQNYDQKNTNNTNKYTFPEFKEEIPPE